MASTQLSSSEIMMTRKSERQYSPVLSCEAPMGANASTATAVAPRSGHLFCSTMAMAAFTLSRPFCAATSTPSAMTMALSTSIPSAMMNAPRLMRSSRMPIHFMTISDAMTVTTSTTPMSTPLRSPIATSSTATTMITDSTRLIMNPLTAACTLLA